MPKISIIVPVYNVERYIGRCVESIISQTFKDWELILVDDGSPDGSGSLCDEYAIKDSRIKVFHKKNEGVSSARNFGIRNASGEWITFVDSDDWIEENFLMDLLPENFGELSMQGYKIFRGDKFIENHIFNYSCSTSDILKVFLESEKANIINSPVSKLFRTNIILDNSLFFDLSISYGEDHLFVLEYLKYVKLIHVSEKDGYVYNQGDYESLTRRIVPHIELLDYIKKMREKQLNIFNVTSPYANERLLDAISYRYYSVVLKIWENFFKDPAHSYCDYKVIAKDLWCYNLSKKYLRKKQRIFFTFIENVPSYVSYITLKSIFFK